VRGPARAPVRLPWPSRSTVGECEQCQVKEVLGWPKICKLAHAFLWEHSHKLLKLGQLLGQLARNLVSFAIKRRMAPQVRLVPGARALRAESLRLQCCRPDDAPGGHYSRGRVRH
jgi:hypothetical protein